MEELIRETRLPHLSGIPADLDLAGAEIEVARMEEHLGQLRRVLQPVDGSGGNSHGKRRAHDEVGAPSAQFQHQLPVVDLQRDTREAAEKYALLDAPEQRVGLRAVGIDQLDVLGPDAYVRIRIRLTLGRRNPGH